MTKGKDPFAELEKLRASLPKGPEPAPAKEPPAKAQPRAPARAIVRMERKGRGGKEATLIELRRGQDADRSGLPPAELERWCRELKQALGCGGSVDGGMIVLQGDLRPRIAAALEARGVGRVTIG
jgi:translation initiation factor 1